ncbi:hypothetical protein XAP6164_260008 [Xanthomonas phaseoli pv. phaseoli]|nr:hypothetical protein XAP6164_260008 [Xanthomonas phaseoli pv. phaseoli]
MVVRLNTTIRRSAFTYQSHLGHAYCFGMTIQLLLDNRNTATVSPSYINIPAGMEPGFKIFVRSASTPIGITHTTLSIQPIAVLTCPVESLTCK